VSPRLSSFGPMLVCAVVLLSGISAPALAQDAPTSAPPSTVVGSAVAASASPTASAAKSQAHPSVKAGGTIPYTIREGDTLGSVAQLFGVPVEDLAHINHMRQDTELYVGDALKIPNPFTAEVNGLKSQIESLSTSAQAAEHKADDLEKKLTDASTQVQDLSSTNQTLSSSVRSLPWWRAMAVAAVVAAVLMFGVMMVTAFEWWRMRRRYVALADLSDSLGRLDQKYKILLAKAELRIQQIYGRRRGAIAEGQPRPKLPEEIELEHLNAELKEVLERQLERMGARPGSTRRNLWRDLFGSLSSPAESMRR
jgi:LysM repeat protein